MEVSVVLKWPHHSCSLVTAQLTWQQIPARESRNVGHLWGQEEDNTGVGGY